MQEIEEVELICYRNELDRAEEHFNELFDDDAKEDEHPLTDSLRRLLDLSGIEYTKGFLMPDGRRVDEDDVTEVWPIRNHPCEPLTFIEEDGYMSLDGSCKLTPRMAIVMAAVAASEWREGNE